MPISLRVPPELVKRVAKLASSQDVSPHAFMIEAIQEKLEAEEAQSAFRAEAERRLTAMKKSGRGLTADEVFRYLDARIKGQKARRPASRKIK
jgi:predicted transcriptional regulator